jgi:hypothetical protein
MDFLAIFFPFFSLDLPWIVVLIRELAVSKGEFRKKEAFWRLFEPEEPEELDWETADGGRWPAEEAEVEEY